MKIPSPVVLTIYIDGQIATKECLKAAFYTLSVYLQLLDKPCPLSMDYAKVWES